MKNKLEKLLKNAHSPFFNFPVAAILVAKDGKLFEGVNVEISNGSSICAERNAITKAIASGYKKGDFEKIYIMFGNGQFGTPCFSCRQFLVDFFDISSKVISIDSLGNEKEYTVEDLCPFPFGADDLL